MNLQTGVNMRWPLVALAAALLLATGAGATYLVLRQPITATSSSGTGAAMPASMPPPGARRRMSS